MKLRNYLNFNPKVELRAIRVKNILTDTVLGDVPTPYPLDHAGCDTDTVLCDENSMIISLFARTIWNYLHVAGKLYEIHQTLKQLWILYRFKLLKETRTMKNEFNS